MTVNNLSETTTLTPAKSGATMGKAILIAQGSSGRKEAQGEATKVRKLFKSAKAKKAFDNAFEKAQNKAPSKKVAAAKAEVAKAEKALLSGLLAAKQDTKKVNRHAKNITALVATLFVTRTALAKARGAIWIPDTASAIASDLLTQAQADTDTPDNDRDKAFAEQGIDSTFVQLIRESIPAAICHAAKTVPLFWYLSDGVVSISEISPFDSKISDDTRIVAREKHLLVEPDSLGQISKSIQWRAIGRKSMRTAYKHYHGAKQGADGNTGQGQSKLPEVTQAARAMEKIAKATKRTDTERQELESLISDLKAKDLAGSFQGNKEQVADKRLFQVVATVAKTLTAKDFADTDFAKSFGNAMAEMVRAQERAAKQSAPEVPEEIETPEVPKHLQA